MSDRKSRMMNDNELKQKLQESLQSMQGEDVPAFDRVWADAQDRYSASRSGYRKFAGGVAAAAVATMAFMLWSTNGSNGIDAYLTEEELMSSTQWLAPSDVLLPEHEFDIYGELPVLIELNDLDEGSQL